jgi:ferritin-like metal-binding protein YciE
MAELTKLEDKLGEVLGLAKAGRDATKSVAGMLDDEELVATLTRMSEEAAETARRCEEVADARTGRKTAILDKARETTSEAKEMMQTYLGEDAEGLDGLEFLSMAEAGEVSHVEILGAMARSAGDDDVIQLVEWALPIQERHLAIVREGGVAVASEEDPEEPA